MPVRPGISLGAPLLLALLATLPLSAQHADTTPRPAGTGRAASELGSVRGLVTDSADHAVAGAEVLLDAGERSAATDASGRFRIDSLPPGRYALEIRALAYRERRDSVGVLRGRESAVHVELAPEAVPLDTLAVLAHPSKLTAVGFYRRRSRGLGSFYTWQDLRRHHVRRLSDLLGGMAGLTRTVQSDGTSRITMRGAKTFFTNCTVQFFLDGVQADVPLVGADVIPVRDILGIEIYRGASELPLQFDVGNALCGGVLIWTRNGETP